MHIVFQQEDVNSLSASFSLDESLSGEIIQIKDDYAVGPLQDIESSEGIEGRKQWWREVLSGTDYSGSVDSGEVDDVRTLGEIKKQLLEDGSAEIRIWIAPNAHDVSGYYWLVSQLKEFAGRVWVLWLHNLPFISEKGTIFYPDNLHDIPPREFIKAQKLARPVTPSEFELDPEEWTRIGGENKMVRRLEGGKKLSQHEADFYDGILKGYLSQDWQKTSKVISHFLNKSQQVTGDAYLLWRLKQLISAGLIDAQGDIRNAKDFEVKMKSGQSVMEPQAAGETE